MEEEKKEDPITESLSNKTKTYCTYKKKLKGETEQPDNYCITSMNLGKKTFPMITLLMGIMTDQIDEERTLYEKLSKTGYLKVMGLKGNTYDSYIKNEKKEIDYLIAGKVIQDKITGIPKIYRLQLIGHILGVETIGELKQLNDLLKFITESDKDANTELNDLKKLWYTVGNKASKIEAHQELTEIIKKDHEAMRLKNKDKRRDKGKAKAAEKAAKKVEEETAASGEKPREGVSEGGSFRITKNIKQLYMSKTHKKSKRRYSRGGALTEPVPQVSTNKQQKPEDKTQGISPISPPPPVDTTSLSQIKPQDTTTISTTETNPPWWRRFMPFGGGSRRRKLKRRKQTKRR
jgi:hypothetical protein